MTRYLETRSQNFQQQLVRANNAKELNTIKARFQQWLTKFFASYRDISSRYEQLDAERIIHLTAEADVNTWINGHPPGIHIPFTGTLRTLSPACQSVVLGKNSTLVLEIPVCPRKGL